MTFLKMIFSALLRAILLTALTLDRCRDSWQAFHTEFTDEAAAEKAAVCIAARRESCHVCGTERNVCTSCDGFADEEATTPRCCV